MNYLVLLLLLCLVSCVEKKNEFGIMSIDEVLKIKEVEKGSPVTFDDDLEPSLPDMKKNAETVAGVDADADGMRDDIEIWINRNFKTANERRALKQYAGLLMKELIMADEGRPTKEIHENSQEVSKSRNCLGFVFKVIEKNYRGHYSMIHELAGNIYEGGDKRDEAYKKKEIALAGAVTGAGMSPRDDYQFCKFKVEGQEEIRNYLKQYYD